MKDVYQVKERTRHGTLFSYYYYKLLSRRIRFDFKIQNLNLGLYI